ncbi:hypothetical protein NT239_00110 [Chitinibacter sp. SCUT-21]|uniref:hypothetical protein n=1 Tax=Chitinibacter sp. SCUT-21 TaxID=2970891 RepID=UPI0035A5BE2E
MRRFLTKIYSFLRSVISGVHYDAFSRTPFYLTSEWEVPRRCTPMSCEEETLEQLRDRWRFH